nr:hypothetical protein GCM10020092_071240 [Actinoplanes digitatis]
MGYRISRRGLLNGAAGVAAAGTLAGCAMGGDDDTESDAKGEVSAANPLGVKEDAPLEVVIFNGGFGEEYAKAHEAMYQERYPKAEIKHSSTQKIAETLQPRFVAGDPPDVVNNSGGSQIDFNGLVSQGALTDLGELLDAPSLDDPAKKVRDTLLPGIVDVGSYDGKFLSLNYAYSAYGVWYSRKLFESKGWQYPKTWDEMIALCKKIKAARHRALDLPGQALPLHELADPRRGRQAGRHRGDQGDRQPGAERLEARGGPGRRRGLLPARRRRLPPAGRRGHGPRAVADRVVPGPRRVRLLWIVAGERAEVGHPAGLPDGRRADAQPHHERQDAVRGVPRHRQRAVHRPYQGQERPRRPGVPAGHALAAGRLRLHPQGQQPHLRERRQLPASSSARASRR